MYRRDVMKAAGAVLFGGTALAGCTEENDEEDLRKYGGYDVEVVTEETEEIRLHSSNNLMVPRYTHIRADEEYVVGFGVGRWTDDRLKVEYDLKELTEETVEDIQSEAVWMDKQDAVYLEELFNEVDTDVGVELAAIDWDPDIIESDHDAYFIPADADTFTQVAFQKR